MTVLVLSSCSTEFDDPNDRIDSGPSPVVPDDIVDDAAQPLDAVVADAVAPVGGASASNMMRVDLWGGQVLLEKCDQPFFGREGDRFDQVLFPDFDRIAVDGIGALESFDNPIEEPVPVEGPEPDQACRERTLPAFVAGEAIKGQWFDTIVFPLWQSPQLEASKVEVTACLNDRLPDGMDPIPSLDHFFAAVDAATRQATGTRDQQRSEIAAIDRSAATAFTHCAQGFYQDLQAQLVTARDPFIDQHAEAVQDLARELDSHGYVP